MDWVATPCARSFLFHSVLHLTWAVYDAIRKALGARRRFFNDLRALTIYIYFSSWDAVIDFMAEQLEVGPI